jgi:hydrogenase-4 component B
VTPLGAVLLGLGALLTTGFVALLLAPLGRAAQWIATLGTVAGCLVGLLGAVSALVSAPALPLTAPWQVPGGALIVSIDALSAFFLIPLFAFAPLAAVYGRAYLAHRGDAARTAVASAVLALLVAAMALVLLARHAMLFLVAWEAMALLAYVLISTDHTEAEVRRAGWTYLIASHVGVLALIGLFLALASHAGGALDFAAFQRMPELSPSAVLGLLALALVGFGVKAGVPGLHVWLPEAHAAAPSHVSALMSAVLVKLGVYGMLRVATMLPVPEAAGATLMLLGLVGALGGIALALQQRDLKRVLAYSTIENLGIVLFGLGLGFWARSRGDLPLAALGFAGGLLHVWNHCAMKGLLFLAAGGVLHATGTKDLERLGGLLRKMPVTGAATVVGAVAIAGLPPLNGFVGEWLIYRGLATASLAASSWVSVTAMAGIAALAVVGALATLCFVRLIGVALLGEPRSESAQRAHEPSWEIAGPVVLLAAVCVLLALASPALADALSRLVGELCGANGAAANVRAALVPLAALYFGFFGALLAGALLIIRLVKGAASDATWGCGYTAPNSRMQYTASSFGELASHHLTPTVLRTRAESAQPRGPFPDAVGWSSSQVDPLTRAVYEPLLSSWGDRFARLRWVQQGNLHFYLLYLAGSAVLGLVWAALRSWWVA